MAGRDPMPPADPVQIQRLVVAYNRHSILCASVGDTTLRQLGGRKSYASSGLGVSRHFFGFVQI
ncbi:hypothetical protein QF002_000922 [Paraburkholderia youngii]